MENVRIIQSFKSEENPILKETKELNKKSEKS